MVLVYRQVWKVIKDFPDYEISNYGQIKSWKNGRYGLKSKPRILSPIKVKGYLMTGIYENKKPKVFLTHRLVLEHFFGPCPAGMQACHNNGKRDEPDIWNLRWDTCKNNMADKIKHGTNNNNAKGEKHGCAKLKEKDIPKIFALRKRGFTLKEIGNVYGVTKENIGLILNKKSWGYLWKK